MDGMHHYDADVDVFADEVFSFARKRAALDGATLGRPRTRAELVAARSAAQTALSKRGVQRPARWAIVCGESAHSSVRTSAAAMDTDIVQVPGHRLTGAALRPVLAEVGERACAVVATAGSTNLGQ